VRLASERGAFIAAAGVYYYRIEACGYEAAGKLVLLR
jgi:hypothetical protein